MKPGKNPLVVLAAVLFLLGFALVPAAGAQVLSIYGVVYHDDGSPATASSVGLTKGDGPIFWSQTDADGNYAFFDLPAGGYVRLDVYPPAEEYH